MTVAQFAEAVSTYGVRFRASCTSWGRSALHNAAVGGVLGGPHVAWVGADLIYDSPIALEVTRRAFAAELGLTLIVEADHDHLQPRDWVNL